MSMQTRGASLRHRSTDRRRTALASTIVLVAGLYAIYAVTDGLRAFSLESARRLSALRSPAALPDPLLELADGRRTSLMEPGRILLVDFIYTRCTTYCRALGSTYAQLQSRLAAEIGAGQVRLVSISFDPAHDDPVALQNYRNRYAADGFGWNLARPLSTRDLERLLRAFGVVVIDDGLGGLTHNAAVHVVDGNGRLAAILDLDDLDGVVQFTRGLLGVARAHAAML